MSNLHLLLDEANKHDPKGFIPAPFNTFSVKNELGVSFYEERMSLPKAINFVDGTLAPPTTVNNDVYVIIGAGVIAAGWGNATFGDWVKFTNSLPGEIVPLAGYLCYDSTAASWMEYDGALWATFGGGGGADTNLATNDLTLTDPSRFYDVNGNDFQFKDGANNRVRINANGVAIGNSATPVAGTALFIAGSGSTNGTTGFRSESSSGANFFEFTNDGSATLQSSSTGGLWQKYRNTAAAGYTNIKIHDHLDADKGGIQYLNSGIVSAYRSDVMGFLSNANGMYFQDSSSSFFKWALGTALDATTNMKLTTNGLYIGSGIGALTDDVRLLVKGRTSSAVLNSEWLDSNAGNLMSLANNGVWKLESTVAANRSHVIGSAGSGTYTALGFSNDAGNIGETIVVGTLAGFGGNALLTGAYSIRTNALATRTNFIDGSGGGMYFITSSGAENSTTDMKLTTSGLLVGDGIGLSTAGARLHVIGSTRLDDTTVLSKTISTDFFPVNINGTVRYLALYD